MLLLVLQVKLVEQLLALKELELTTENIRLDSRLIITRLRKTLLVLDLAQIEVA